MPTQFYAALIALYSMIGIAVFVILRLWFMEYRPPEWRTLRWTEQQFRIMNWRPKWEEWFAWRPVKVHGEWVWMETVYRRCLNTYVDYDDWKRYEYGNIFDKFIMPKSRYAICPKCRK